MLTLAIAYLLLLPFTDHFTLVTYFVTALFACAIQIVFCLKSKHTAVRLIPLYVLLAEFAVCGIILLSITGWDALIGWVGLVAVGVAAVGVAVAWAAFAIYRYVKS